MSKRSQAKSLHDTCKELNSWDKAIYDAEQKVKTVEGKLAGLKAALAVCKERRERGEPFPGEASETFEADR
jgi:hypothetical protein